MRNKLSSAFAMAAALGGISGASVATSSAQVPQRPPPGEARPPVADPAIVAARQRRTPDEAAANFVRRNLERQQRRSAVLQQRGRAADEQQLRDIFGRARIPRPAPGGGVSAATVSALATSVETDTVQLLQSLGVDPGRVRRLAAAGFDPLQSAADLIRGTASITDQALLADLVAIVRVKEVRNERLGDGYRSSVVLDIVEEIAGRAGGREIAVRQMSGLDENGESVWVSEDLHAVVGQTYVVMLSQEYYEQLAAEKTGGRRAREQFYVPFGSIYSVNGDTLVPIVGAEGSGASLAALRSTLAPLARAKANAQSGS